MKLTKRICICFVMIFAMMTIAAPAAVHAKEVQNEKVIINGEEKIPVLTVIDEEQVPLANQILPDYHSHFPAVVIVVIAAGMEIWYIGYSVKHRKRMQELQNKLHLE